MKIEVPQHLIMALEDLDEVLQKTQRAKTEFVKTMLKDLPLKKGNRVEIYCGMTGKFKGYGTIEDAVYITKDVVTPYMTYNVKTIDKAEYERGIDRLELLIA